MSYPPAPPPYNPSAPPPQGGGVGFEQYQQGTPYPAPPPYSNPYPAPYPQHGHHQQQHGHYPPYGQPHMVYTEQPKTVYVYDDRRRRHDNSDAADCFLWGLCAACLCCCLLDS
ncbi:protein lifeguard 1-like [Orbicella faveolata]|uniref:protein lifeguard 1-like n=1 Tax=Orbicella faveolata TaxID=48498 RepID=UPI0009E617E8|nr:protein lifeguard 1-like [Orbicella faveolata]